jgi:4-oxalomesaconate hydratase
MKEETVTNFKKPRLMIISGHAADFVWRCGGTIANYTQNGSQAHIVCLTLGQRGESEALWKKGITSEDEIIRVRTDESIEAANRLGATIEFCGYQDHPFLYDQAMIERLARIICKVQPHIILTHHDTDVNNPDHESVYQLTRWAVRAASVKGAVPDQPALEFAPNLLAFEPDQSSLDGFLPDTYIDISDTADIKRSAMQAVASQADEMIGRYMDRAAFRASLMRNVPGAKYAEGFVRLHPFEGQLIPLCGLN